MHNAPDWPALPLATWRNTRDTLHMWTQIAGKISLALTPRVNHFWNIALQVTPRGLQTPTLACGARTFTLLFDFIAHELVVAVADGERRTVPLAPQTVADFYAGVMGALAELGIDVRIWTMPSEIEGAVPFEQDRTHAQYDPAMAQRFWQALLQADRVLKVFRSRFIGKASPVHFFWGSFDLAVTRFSGRTAPAPGGATPNVASWVMAEAYSHEVSSCGFWPGNGGYGRAAFYVYAYPEPSGYSETPLSVAEAFYDKGLGQFILPYDAVRQASDPDALLLAFLQETYAAAANAAKWDREALERRGA
jgi:hypothetical protein